MKLFIALMLLMASLILIPNATASTQVYLSSGQAVLDAKNNIISGEGFVTIDTAAATSPACSWSCQIKKALGLQSALAPGNVLHITQNSPTCASGTGANQIQTFSKTDLQKYTQIGYDYLDFDNQVHSITLPNAAVPHFDFRPLNPAYGNPDGLTSTYQGSQGNDYYLPTPEVSGDSIGYSYMMNQDGGATLTCGTSDYLQVGPRDIYRFDVDTSFGLDVNVVNTTTYLAKLNQPGGYCVQIDLKQNISNNILGGLILQQSSVTYLQATDFNQTQWQPLKGSLQDNIFQVCGPSDKLGTQQIKVIPYVVIRVPYIELQWNPYASSGSGLTPVKKFADWYGTADKQLNIQYEVLYPEQIGPPRPGTVAYVSPYAKQTGYLTPAKAINYATPYQNQSSNNWPWILGAIAIIGTLVYIFKKK